MDCVSKTGVVTHPECRESCDLGESDAGSNVTRDIRFKRRTLGKPESDGGAPMDTVSLMRE